jgi:AcrR family transcriptional regulator
MSSADRRPAVRPYRMRRRAERLDDTRRRIVEATVELHGTVGPSGTTFLGVAERAGVTRATVYRHFPDEEALFAACSAHWLAQQVAPNPSAWAAVPDPVDRLRAALTDLYRFYRAGAPMLMRIFRDLDFLPDRHRRGLLARDEQARELLLAAYPQRRRRNPRLRAAIGHAVTFSTWHSLCIDNGIPNDDAVAMMLTLANAADEAGS